MNLSRIRTIYNFTAFNLRNISISARKLTRSNTENVVPEEPVKYSISPASKYKAKFTRTGITEPRLWYEPLVILTSLAAFLIYFAILREENDIDQELNTSLYSRIAGLEEYQLKLSLQYNQENGLETEAIVKRLKEIEKEKSELGLK